MSPRVAVGAKTHATGACVYEPTVAAVTASDRTCVAIFGVPWRTVRALCRKHGITVARAGRRPVVLVADVLRALGLGDVEPSSTKRPKWDEAAAVQLYARTPRGSR